MKKRLIKAGMILALCAVTLLSMLATAASESAYAAVVSPLTTKNVITKNGGSWVRPYKTAVYFTKCPKWYHVIDGHVDVFTDESRDKRAPENHFLILESQAHRASNGREGWAVAVHNLSHKHIFVWITVLCEPRMPV